jgi:hypothetical protein
MAPTCAWSCAVHRPVHGQHGLSGVGRKGPVLWARPRLFVRSPCATFRNSTCLRAVSVDFRSIHNLEAQIVNEVDNDAEMSISCNPCVQNVL